MDDQLMAYLRERNAARERQWLPIPRYRQRPCLIVKYRCGHSDTTGSNPTSGLGRCRSCWDLQLIDAINQPRFITPGPSKGRRW